MLFSVIVALIVIVVAAFWAYQGFFSSAIMFFESVIAVMLAFAFFENVHGLWADSLDADLGLPLAFMLIFLLSLVVMRVATDKLIPNTVMFPLYVERAGGGLCGFFTGMILIGMALVAIQMLPVGSAVLGFERWQTNKEGLPFEKSIALGLKPDAFVVGLAEMLSTDRFGGDNPLAQTKPDFLQDIYSARAAPQTEARTIVPPDCLRVVEYWDFRQIDHVSQSVQVGTLHRSFTTHEPASSLNKFLVCRVRLYASAAHKQRAGEIRFRTPQFRLVGRPPGKTDLRVYLACGMSDIYTHKEHDWSEIKEDQPARLVRFSPLTDFALTLGNAKAVAKVTSQDRGETVEYYEFNVVFEVPDGPDFSPLYIEFKRGARKHLTGLKPRKEPPGYATAALSRGGGSARSEGFSSSGAKVGRPGRGRTHVANAVEERTGVSAFLPIPLDKNDRLVSRRLRGGKFQEGHVYVVISDEELDSGSEVTEFLVPSGKRMVQIGAEQVMAGSLYGRAMNYAATVVAQIKIHTAGGQTYFAQGVYASAPVGGETIFEVQYWPDPGIPERCLKKPKKLTKSIMTNAKESERKFGYIFLVDPGVTITGFSAGRRDQTPQKLNIKVPD